MCIVIWASGFRRQKTTEKITEKTKQKEAEDSGYRPSSKNSASKIYKRRRR